MATSPEFGRIISLRQLFSLSLLPPLLCAIASALLTIPAVLCLACAVSLILSAKTDGAAPALQTSIQQLLATLWINDVPGSVNRLLESTRSGVAFITILLLATTFWTVRGLLNAASRRLCRRHIGGAVIRLRQHIHRKAIRLEPADLSGREAETAERLFQKTAEQLEQQAVRWSDSHIPGLPELGVLVLFSLLVDWHVALQTMIPVLLGVLVLHRESLHHDTSRLLLTETIQRSLKRISASLLKARIVSNFGMEAREQEQFLSQLNAHDLRCRQRDNQSQVRSAVNHSITLITVGLPAIILGFQVLQGFPIFSAIVLTGTLSLFAHRIQQIQTGMEAGRHGSALAQDIADYLRRVPTVSQKSAAGFLPPMARTLTFNQVCFQPDGDTLLLNSLDLRITAGETIALLSLQPAAAYAAAVMIPRFIDPDPGQILIDGVDIREGTLESLRAEAIFVGGSDPVFDATVLENITCGQPDITKQQAIDAAKSVHADHFIRTLPMGYETQLGEQGLKPDPGQTFRLSLARAAVRRPAILIIEEPSTPLDSETKTLLDDAYQRISADKTILFLPTRLSTVKRCSRIVMIHEGRVAADGTHEQLVRTSELYQHWEYLRFNSFRNSEDT